MDKKRGVFLILHNIRSLHNIGSIFRTADAAGVNKIFLTGYTPTPVDVFEKTKKEILKTALGAEKFVAWEKIKSAGFLIKKLKGEKVFIVGVEQARGAVNYRKIRPRFPVALIFGNEVRGINKNILSKCDKIMEIPMYGKKESLNVAVSIGIILYEIIHK